MRLIKSAMNKVCNNIEQKGVAQLLQIEEVQLNSSRRCCFSQSPHAQEASVLLVSTQFDTHFVRLYLLHANLFLS